MIYALIGTDLSKKKTTLNGLVTQYKDFEFITVNQFNFNNEELGNFIAGEDIFSKKYLIVLDGLLESGFTDDVLVKIEQMKDSDNIFVFKELSLLKKPTDLLKKHAKVFENFNLLKQDPGKFNIFSITDSFGSKDKKNTWVLMQKALREGVKPEDILNILIWQTKNLLMVQNSKHIIDTGLSTFVYNKTKEQARNFKNTELKDISRSLVRLFHEGHLGVDLGLNLEIFILKTL